MISVIINYEDLFQLTYFVQKKLHMMKNMRDFLLKLNSMSLNVLLCPKLKSFF